MSLLDAELARRTGAIATVWRLATTPAELAIAAAAMARQGWPADDIAEGLQRHPSAPSPAVAAGMAADAVATVAAARAAAAAAKAADEAAAATSDIEIVSVILSRPPEVVIAMGDRRATITMRDLGSRVALRQICLEVFLRPPTLPKPKHFDDWLRAALDAAPRVEEPDDASEPEHERYAVERALATLPLTRVPAETLARCAYVDRDEPAAYIHLPAIMAGTIRPSAPTLSVRRVAAILRELGWEPAKIRAGDTTFRLWRGPAEQYLARESEWADYDEADAFRQQRLAARETTP